MKKTFTLSLLITILFACQNSEKKSNLLTEEKKIETDIEKPIENEKTINFESSVEVNLIHCKNEKFTIKIDRLKNGDVRYISWNKPKTTTNEPDLILLSGSIEKQGTAGGYHFLFSHGTWQYIIENNFIGETEESMGVFLKLTNNGNEKLYTKMTDLKKQPLHP